MKYPFTLPDFPDSNFQIEVSFWTGRQTLYKDEVLVERSTEKGKPFLVPDHNGDIVKAYPKATFPEIVPALEIDNLKYNIVEKLKWYQAVLAVMPFSIVFIGGGALGGGIGAVAFMLNLQLFLIPSTIWNYPKEIFKDRSTYRTPKWGINISKKNMHMLQHYSLGSFKEKLSQQMFF